MVANISQNSVSNPVEQAKEYADKVKTEAAEHDKLTQDDDYYRTIASRVNSGFYSKAQLESIFSNLKLPDCTTTNSANGILYAGLQNLMSSIKEGAESQLERLEDFDFDVRYEDIVTDKTDIEGAVTKEDWDFANCILKELQDSGDNSISLQEVLCEVKNGYYNNI